MNAASEAEAILRDFAARPEDEIDLGEGGLALAAMERPRAPLADYRAHLADIADSVARRASGDIAGAADRLEVLNAAILGDHAYAGDTETYDDIQNANMFRVIDRRKGLPVALGILYIHGARAQSWQAAGVNFPGHFLIRLDVGAEQIIADPFHGGRVVGAAELRRLLKLAAGQDAELTPEHYRPAGNRQVLIRLHNNIKFRRLRDGAIERAVAAIEAMLMLAPDEIELWSEASALNARLGNMGAAIAALESCLEHCADDELRYSIAASLQQLRTKLN